MKKRSVFFLCVSFFLFISSSLSAQIKYAVIPDNPRPGEPITIAVETELKQALLVRSEKQLAKADFFSIPGYMIAVLAIPSTVAPGNAVIVLENKIGILCEIPIVIGDRKFASEVIELNQTLTGIRTDPSPQRTHEANFLWAILTTNGDQIYHTGSFVPPVTSTRRTSFFGDRRVFQYSTGESDTSIHAGVDYGVPTGTKVTACGAGKVILARSRIVTGNSVVLEHAPGIYSIYYHLDKIEVQESALVNTGTLLGLSGATGLATGPHLHWEVRVNAENTDPDAFVARPIIDKETIISKMNK
ncbi:MAG: M23 family metallopeptidase [Treponema sp.]|jgi:murein DD-endopeptidase MepM/ murein hydrolase activator NlpD|nr:M23 family metallopeptidase [Treponema sp.]